MRRQSEGSGGKERERVKEEKGGERDREKRGDETYILGGIGLSERLKGEGE